MLICKDCGETIRESDLRRIVLNRVDGFTEYGVEDTCRECGSQELVEAGWCEICGGWFPADQLTDHLCPECYEEAEQNLNSLSDRKISEKQYRRHPALSRSELWRLSDSPEKFQYAQTHPTEPTEAMLFGSLVHKMVLEPDDLFTEYALAPDSDRRTKAGKAEWDEFLAEAGDRIVVSNRQLRPALYMVDAIKRSPLAMKLLAGPHEIPFFWSDPETGLVLKCRVDGLIELNGRIAIIDYKTAASAQTERFSQEAIRYGYHFQAAFYGSGVRKDLELDYDPEFIFIVQEKKEPYSINVIKASEGFVLAGQDKMRELLGLYQECSETGVWYGYTGFFDDINETVLPGWMQLGIDEEEE